MRLLIGCVFRVVAHEIGGITMTDSRLGIVKYINDPVYGGIPITQVELELISLPIFQRLRGLRQLARVNYVFPGAEHSRFVHSLGVLYIMGLMTDHLMKQGSITEDDAVKMRVAALLHDIGHYPLSHLGESVYGYCLDNEDLAPQIIAGLGTDNRPLYEMVAAHSRSAHHEHLGKYIVVNHIGIVQILRKYSLDPNEIAEIFTGEIGSKNMLYSQLLHSSLDADRLDYLLRDSYQTGVKYGLVDLQYLIRLLMVVEDPGLDSGENKKVLVCNKKGQHVVEHFLMSRYFHYSQIIHHKTNGAFEGLVKAMYIKLLRDKGFMYNSLSEIHAHINDYEFLSFNDSSLEVAFKNYYEKTSDAEYKALYRMYTERKRPKVVFEMKDLYETSPQPSFSVLKWELKREPQKISEIIGGDNWGYQIIPITIEKIHGHYPLTERSNKHDEDLREAVKLYDADKETISYLAADSLSIIGHLSYYKSEFVRIFVFDEDGSLDYEKITREIRSMIQS